MTLDEEKQLLETVGGRRLMLCRSMRSFVSCIENMPIDAVERQELVNLANVLLRLSVLKNDGGPISPHRVPAH